jgi:arginyl-tRNA synthetase
VGQFERPNFFLAVQPASQGLTHHISGMVEGGQIQKLHTRPMAATAQSRVLRKQAEEARQRSDQCRENARRAAMEGADGRLMSDAAQARPGDR